MRRAIATVVAMTFAFLIVATFMTLWLGALVVGHVTGVNVTGKMAG